ncbi:type II toxin-antitoxin system VapC family toxin [Mucilaginibacter ginsenosidivorax]|uniref:Ribonuclease VapC n=1 Tax=Mucilaginibacter ginsenosidivorax TaxID=862126 RepID=A0A5B8W309_9SPHI|nr:type II toxin-antitoxin system VapC family toxin [Mucilaginibacter ginsenosidivorax]QEC77322.1 type II toxin-antitoxin system VapC family toxin [Mucilaginibacter ginsenosidivorax]
MAAEKIICDTDVIIDYFDTRKSRHEETRIILEQKIGFQHILISSITKMELISGANNKADLHKISKDINRFGVLLINPEINLRAIDLVQSYRLSHGLAIADAMIAATAIQTELKLFTYNIKDFKFISKLSLYKPE